MPHYDIILAGAGAAGLSLAYCLAHSPLRDRSILVVDKDVTERRNRTWCFWTNRPTPYEHIVYRSWRRLRFTAQRITREIDLGDYRYQMIRGADFFGFVQQEISKLARVDLVQGTIDRIEDGPHAASTWVDGREHTGTWVFDSRYCVSTKRSQGPWHTLTQQFTGWDVTTTQAAFDPRAATFLDFRTPQRNEARFFYVLPLSEYQAIVDYVTCGPEEMAAPQHQQALSTYLHEELGFAGCHIQVREAGSSPLTDRQFPRRIGRHVMAIGTLGGRIKPTTGFAFTRIQRDSAAIVVSLLRFGHPFSVPCDPWRFRLYDAAMLDIMAQNGDRIEPIFRSLFMSNPVARILSFLDERTALWDELRLAATLPPDVALRALSFRRIAQMYAWRRP